MLTKPYARVSSDHPFLFLQGSSHHLSQLLYRVAMSHMQHGEALLVGYTMKPSRERNLASRGLLPLTAPHGLCFVPIDFALPLEQQGPFDILLHKVRHWLQSSIQLIRRLPVSTHEMQYAHYSTAVVLAVTTCVKSGTVQQLHHTLPMHIAYKPCFSPFLYIDEVSELCVKMLKYAACKL